MTWLRPFWLLALLPIAAIAWHLARARLAGGHWTTVVDPALRPYVLDGEVDNARSWLLALPLAWAVATLMLAGPVWQRVPVPVFQGLASEVWLLDLSASMRTTDVTPDRFERARFKLFDLLQRSEGRQVGLVAFAERPYVISPLTEDRETLRDFIPSLSPEIVPVQGSRLDLAIERAAELLAAAGVRHGDVIALTDNAADARTAAAAEQLAAAGHRLSILAVGTASGAPLKRADGHFQLDASGAIVVPQLDLAGLQSIAQRGGGVGVALRVDSQDIDSVRARLATAGREGESSGEAEQVYWREWAYWLLPGLTLAALSLFRRGVCL